MDHLHPDSRQSIQDIKNKLPKNEKVVFVSGNFNIVHPGHLRLLRFASDCGNILIVGVLGDHSQSAILSEDLRLEGVKSISWVDHAFILRDSPENFIRELKPAIVVKGKEHENLHNPELEALKQYNGKLLFSSGDVKFSSMDLLRHELRDLNYSKIEKPINFLQRHGFTFDDLKLVLQNMQKINVLVIGDTIVDEYITCDPVGMSQEDPTIVVTPLLSEHYIGGASIVAAHAKGIGNNVYFFSITGKDTLSSFVSKEMSQYGIAAHLYEDESRPTTLKQRYRANEKTLLRVNHFRQHSINREIQERLLKDLLPTLENIHLIIFSDFNYGCLPQPLVDEIISHCRKRKIMMVADSQSSSQVGNISRFQNMALLTPTEREARLALQDNNSGLVVLAKTLQEKSRSKHVFITLGKEGLLINPEISNSNGWITDRLPAMNSAAKDTTGAGDSLLTCSSMALAAGSDIWQSAYLGSIASAYQVGRIGNIPMMTETLMKEIGG